MPDEPVLVAFGTVGAFRLGIAHHFGAVDCDGDVLAAHGYFKAEPFAVFGQRAVEVAHQSERPALAGSVDSPVAEDDIVAFHAVGVETQGGL